MHLPKAKSRDETERRLRFYVALGLVTAATLMLQIIETRIISVISWYHLAFFVISIAMFGLTAGAVFVYLHREKFRPEQLSYHLAVAALAFALTTDLAILMQLTLVTGAPPSLTSLVAWAEFALCLAVPFFFSGVVVSLALTRSPYAIGNVYGADLIGAAAGCIGVPVLLNMMSGPAAVLWVAALIGLAALGFAGTGLGTLPEATSLGSKLYRYRRSIVIGCLLLAIANTLTTYGVRPTIIKDHVETPADLAYDRWNSFSRITVSRSETVAPAMFGASPRLPYSTIEQRALNIDGGAGTALYRFDGILANLGFLRYDVTNLAYAIPDLKTGAVIGVGGGRDVLSQRLFGLSDVTGVEINPIIIDVLERDFSGYTAIATLDGVKFEVDEARSWFARTQHSFDVIQMSLIDTWAATGAGAFTLSENGLYTVEAWQRFLDRLNPGGLFTVSRWYAPGEVNETGRLVSLAVATLLASGGAEPRRHLFLAAAGKVATLIMTKSPLSPAALRALEDAAKANEFTVLLSPETSAPSAVLEKIVSATDRRMLDRATTGFYLDLTPPTDARPFFFNQLWFATLFDTDVFSHFTHTGVFAGNLVATLTLAMLVLISVALVAATIIIPLQPTVREAGWQLAVGGTAYFVLIGSGFMLVEIALLQRMSVFLGHPVYALSVVLFSLILWAGFGSLASERMRLSGTGKLLAWSVASAAYLFALPFWLPPLLVDLDGADLLIRAGFCVLVLAPAGLLMGFGFPTGMRLVSAISTGPTPWFWGINGAAGVLAASIAVATSIAFSIDTTLRIGAACYLLVTAPAMLLMSAGARSSQTALRSLHPSEPTTV
jgi:SAM-dependent methyltransferase